MARVFSIISSQAGAGKTLVTVAIAEILSAVMDKKILFSALGGMATDKLIEGYGWREIGEDHSVAGLIQVPIDPDAGPIHFDAAVRRGASNVHDAHAIDLLPCGPYSALRVAEPTGPVDLLWRAVKSNLDEYVVVLVDCRSGFGIMTRNTLRVSDGYIDPATPYFNVLTSSTVTLAPHVG